METNTNDKQNSPASGLHEPTCSLSLTELLAWADEECAKIECESWPIADTGDYDSAWCVYAYHLNEKDARCIGGGPTIERALRAAWIEEHSPENV
jgi:hypothetical protein